MLSQAQIELRRHYSYYVSLWVIQALLGALISWVIQFFSPIGPLSLVNTSNILMNPVVYESNPSLLINDLVNQGFFQQVGLTFILSLISGYFTTLVSLLVLRSVFQKINFPESRIQESALFNTGVSDAFVLPFKAFFAYLLLGLSYVILFILVGLLVSLLNTQAGLMSILFIIIFLVIVAMLVAAIPITYLLAFDVERKYSFWTTFTKGLQVGFNHFGRILGMILLTILLTMAYAIVVALVIGFLGTMTESLLLVGILGLLFSLVTFLWWFPWLQIFQTMIMNDILSQEY